jgi:hypothetical protein
MADVFSGAFSFDIPYGEIILDILPQQISGVQYLPESTIMRQKPENTALKSLS